MPFDFKSAAKTIADAFGKPEIDASSYIGGSPASVGNIGGMQADVADKAQAIGYNALTGNSVNRVSNEQFGQALGSAAGLGTQGQQYAGYAAQVAPFAMGLINPSAAEGRAANMMERTAAQELGQAVDTGFGKLATKEAREASALNHEAKGIISRMLQDSPEAAKNALHSGDWDSIGKLAGKRNAQKLKSILGNK